MPIPSRQTRDAVQDWHLPVASGLEVWESRVSEIGIACDFGSTGPYIYIYRYVYMYIYIYIHIVISECIVGVSNRIRLFCMLCFPKSSTPRVSGAKMTSGSEGSKAGDLEVWIAMGGQTSPRPSYCRRLQRDGVSFTIFIALNIPQNPTG